MNGSSRHDRTHERRDPSRDGRGADPGSDGIARPTEPEPQAATPQRPGTDPSTGDAPSRSVPLWRQRPAEALYGRRRGPGLSDRQRALLDQLYPRLALDLSAPPPRAATALFSSLVRAVWLEIGFGGGEHLIHQARRHPDVGHLGCEPFENGMAKALVAIDEGDVGNVRLHLGDARDVLDWLPSGAIERVFLLYPDPWPKMRHQKRRFVSRPTLDRLARVMAPGGELRFATDIAGYAEWTLNHIDAHPGFDDIAPGRDRRVPWPGWQPTRYEEKAVAAGRTPRYFIFRRR